jgi:hypothetical protein
MQRTSLTHTHTRIHTHTHTHTCTHTHTHTRIHTLTCPFSKNLLMSFSTRGCIAEDGLVKAASVDVDSVSVEAISMFIMLFS